MRLTEGRYSSVAEMVRATCGDPKFADEFERQLAQRQVINQLVVRRGVQGLPQEEIAERLGCTQGRVSKMENSRDDDLRLGDVRNYAAALGLSTQITFLPKGAGAVERVKFHATQIKQLVNSLAGLAEHDPAIARGVAAFFGEATFNFLMILEEAAAKLPPSARTTAETSMDVEVFAPNGPNAPPRPPKRVRGSRKKETPVDVI